MTQPQPKDDPKPAVANNAPQAPVAPPPSPMAQAFPFAVELAKIRAALVPSAGTSATQLVTDAETIADALKKKN